MCSIFLIKPQRQKTVVLAAKYQLKRVTIAAHHSLFILNDLTHYRIVCCLMNRKGNTFKQTVFLSE